MTRAARPNNLMLVERTPAWYLDSLFLYRGFHNRWGYEQEMLQGSAGGFASGVGAFNGRYRKVIPLARIFTQALLNINSRAFLPRKLDKEFIRVDTY
jgi:hypothetical protein